MQQGDAGGLASDHLPRRRGWPATSIRFGPRLETNCAPTVFPARPGDLAGRRCHRLTSPARGGTGLLDRGRGCCRRGGCASGAHGRPGASHLGVGNDTQALVARLGGGGQASCLSDRGLSATVSLGSLPQRLRSYVYAAATGRPTTGPGSLGGRVGLPPAFPHQPARAGQPAGRASPGRSRRGRGSPWVGWGHGQAASLGTVLKAARARPRC